MVPTPLSRSSRTRRGPPGHEGERTSGALFHETGPPVKVTKPNQRSGVLEDNVTVGQDEAPTETDTGRLSCLDIHKK